MSKIIRIRTKNLKHYQESQRFPLDPIDAQVSVYIRASAEYILYADFQDYSIPLMVGTQTDQVYHFEEDIRSIQVVIPKKSPYSIRILQAGTRYKDMSDPIPYRAIAPLDAVSDTMENRILRAVDGALAARGLSTGKPKGRSYNDSDEEFGTGYEFDEDEAEEIDAAALRAVAKKFAPEKKENKSTLNPHPNDRMQSPRDDDNHKPERGDNIDTDATSNKSGGSNNDK